MSQDPKSVIEELFRRIEAEDLSAIDDLMAEDMVNHAAPERPAREGWKQILSIIKTDLGADSKIEHHHLFGEGDLVAHHMSIRGRHEASTMPLLAAARATPTGKDVSWTYIHIWRVVDGMIVEHWACRDDLGLIRQVGEWPPDGESTHTSAPAART